MLSTCNRLEVYAEALTFHGAVAAIGEALADVSGVDRTELTAHLYVHFEDRAVAHVFSVAAGLDSMAVGEAQILGQLRDALRAGQRAGTVGESLNSLLQQALRVGKRAHTETAIDPVSRSLVEAGLNEAERGSAGSATGRCSSSAPAGCPASPPPPPRGAGARGLLVANRTLARGERLAERHGGPPSPLSRLVHALAKADVVISSTGSAHTWSAPTTCGPPRPRAAARPQVYVDLALPHDVDLAVADLPGATLVGLGELGDDLAERADVERCPRSQAVRDLVTGEVAGYLAGPVAKSVAPTVAALRSAPPRSSRSEMAASTTGCPTSTRRARQELQQPCTGSSRSCSTRRRCGSRS